MNPHMRIAFVCIYGITLYASVTVNTERDNI